jgi:phosphotransferase system  glucose/maltose/N-acetylglucosamine-specific IIC component
MFLKWTKFIFQLLLILILSCIASGTIGSIALAMVGSFAAVVVWPIFVFWDEAKIEAHYLVYFFVSLWYFAWFVFYFFYLCVELEIKIPKKEMEKKEKNQLANC